ncbi:hypothetical protein GCM10011512_09670 [Tersicoccus solisilvae]|uniref:Addiction module protein n=1 Tax=Tersicoccus solisilvae TaxID=1882339 RepID=A0ABQ1NWM4_9MICC|nr:addiction module protein [Tersicoccus solisilvae]GGC84886.1 hypothetical protein GCM10011512_09670 [Tersicoccus solisilvae]
MSVHRRRLGAWHGRLRKVSQAGLHLEPRERTAIARRLLASVRPDDDDAQPDVDAAWRDEIGRRVDDVVNGDVELSSFEQTRSGAGDLLNDLRR